MRVLISSGSAISSEPYGRTFSLRAENEPERIEKIASENTQNQAKKREIF